MAETLVHSTSGDLAHEPSEKQEKGAEKKVERQTIGYTFFKVLPEWRRLPKAEKAAHKAAFCESLRRWDHPGRFLTLTYSTVGTRGDCDMAIWRICYSLEELNQASADLMATPLGGYLEISRNYLAMTKRSQYTIGHVPPDQVDARSNIRPGEHKYAFIYPFLKTRAWYLLPIEERRKIMGEHIHIGLQYPRVKLNTTYSFGLDDQDFVVAFETNYAEDFLDLVQQLRETESSKYTLKDIPVFTCIRMSPEEMLDRLG